MNTYRFVRHQGPSSCGGSEVKWYPCTLDLRIGLCFVAKDSFCPEGVQVRIWSECDYTEILKQLRNIAMVGAFVSVRPCRFTV